MLAASTLSESLNFGNAALLALLGYAVVFFGLSLLMAVLYLLGKAFTAKKAPKNEKAPAQPQPKPAESVSDTVSTATQAAAPGSAGQLKLHNVSPKTAAMLMAIVANQMGKPLNELRFISIKEVES